MIPCCTAKEGNPAERAATTKSRRLYSLMSSRAAGRRSVIIRAARRPWVRVRGSRLQDAGQPVAHHPAEVDPVDAHRHQGQGGDALGGSRPVSCLAWATSPG